MMVVEREVKKREDVFDCFDRKTSKKRAADVRGTKRRYLPNRRGSQQEGRGAGGSEE